MLVKQQLFVSPATGGKMGGVVGDPGHNTDPQTTYSADICSKAHGFGEELTLLQRCVSHCSYC